MVENEESPVSAMIVLHARASIDSDPGSHKATRAAQGYNFGTVELLAENKFASLDGIRSVHTIF